MAVFPWKHFYNIKSSFYFLSKLGILKKKKEEGDANL